MSRSQSLSKISLVVAAAAGVLALPGCSDDCGPGGAPEVGLVAGSDTVTLTYGHLTASANNDCPAAGAPAGVVSLSIGGTQTDGNGLVTLCVSRPDLLGKTAQRLGPDLSTSEVRLVGLTGIDPACIYAIDTTSTAPVPTGSVKAAGLCNDGTNAAGFAITLDGFLSLRRTCGANLDSVQVSLRGTVAVH